nr:uncharacterized protein LOC117840246 [Setaria viridis]
MAWALSRRSPQVRAGYSTILTWLFGTISAALQEDVMEPETTARITWLVLEDQFLGNKESRALHLEAAFRTFVQGDLPVAEYSRRLKSMADALAVAEFNDPVTDRQLVLSFIRGLNDKYAHMVSFLKTQRPFPTFAAEVRSILLLEELSVKDRRIHRACGGHWAVSAPTAAALRRWPEHGRLRTGAHPTTVAIGVVAARGTAAVVRVRAPVVTVLERPARRWPGHGRPRVGRTGRCRCRHAILGQLMGRDSAGLVAPGPLHPWAKAHHAASASFPSSRPDLLPRPMLRTDLLPRPPALAVRIARVKAPICTHVYPRSVQICSSFLCLQTQYLLPCCRSLAVSPTREWRSAAHPWLR